MPLRLVALAVPVLLLCYLTPSLPVPAQVDPPAGDKNPPAKVTFAKDIRPLLQKYCTKCHGGTEPSGSLNLEVIADEAAALKQKELWQKVADMLRAGEMPPPKKPRPTAEEHDQILFWIDQDVFKVDCTQPVDPGKVTLRRLNKAEYNNTIRDLFGLDLQPANDFPDDDVGYGFDNIGDVLTLSPLHLEKYLKASEKIMDAVWKSPDARKLVLSVELKNKDDMDTAKVILKKFAFKAYRRPVSDDEVDKLTRFIKLAQKNKESIEKGIKIAVQAMLCSPHFLFHVEKDKKVKQGEVGHYISDFELASRLSYFLWSSMPDDELFDLAEKKTLRDLGTLAKQVKRMIADPKSEAFVENFAGQWLQLRKLQKHAPDPDVFPKWDEKLRKAMIQETEMFFAAVVHEDRSLYDLLDADFTYANERLAKHYGLEGIKGAEFQRVKLVDSVRGGILGMGSILTLTSNPTRTSPVARGKWVLENLLNAPPPPPPPNVPELDDKGEALKGSLRQRMEMHRKKPECATCHKRMDPLGFGLENFDGIGAWRDKDGKFPVDASGELPTGEKFSGPKELRLVLKTQKATEFRRCLIEKLLIYALGRGLTYYDRCAVDKIAKGLTDNQNRFGYLLTGVVQSDPFLKRKGKN